MKRLLIVVAAVVFGWFIFAEAATEAWYRFHESKVPETSPWGIQFPENDEQGRQIGLHRYSVRELSDLEQEMLRFDQAQAASWLDTKGHRWTAFLIEWDYDKRLNNMDIAHNPTICLPAAGLEYVGELPETTLKFGDRSLEFKSWEFRLQSYPVFVFTAVRRDREFEAPNYSSDLNAKRHEKVLKALKGQRGNPLQTFQMVVIGPRSAEAAAEYAQLELAKFARVITPSRNLSAN